MLKYHGKTITKAQFILIFCTVVFLMAVFFLITFPSYRLMERLYTKTDELNRLNEKWLVLRAEVSLYLTSEKTDSDRERFINSITVFDLLIEYLIDEKLFKLIEKKEKEFRDVRIFIVQNWQNIQYELVRIISEEQSIEKFAKGINWMMIETEDFEKNLKKMIIYANNYSKNRFRMNLIFLYIFSIAVIFLYSISVIEYFQTERAKKSEKEIRNLSKALVSVRENERKRIALDIHDTLIQELNIIKNKLNAHSSMSFLETELAKSIKTAREISFNLRPVEMKDDFISSLKYYLTDISDRNKIKINKSFMGFRNIKLSEDFKINLFRIIQEIFNNIIKHSHADNVDFKLLFSYPYILLTIMDNGVGFDYENTKITSKDLCSDHMGIVGLYERTKLFGGKMAVRAQKDKGCVIKIKIPYNRIDN